MSSDYENETTEEDCDCENCSMVESYFNEIIDTDDFEEVKELLRGLASDAFANGYEESIRDDIKMKVEFLHMGMYDEEG